MARRVPRKGPQRKERTTRWGTRPAQVQLPSVVVVGAGRLGSVLTRHLLDARWPVWVLPQSAAGLRRAVELGLPVSDEETLHDAGLCVLAVPDQVVGALCEKLAPSLSAKTSLVHCAGALTLDALGSRKSRGSFHPLCAVSSPSDPLGGHAVAISATGRLLTSSLRQMAQAVGMTPLQVPEARRSLYHAGAVLAAGSAVALLSAAMRAFQEAGVDPAQSQAALLALTRSALRGVETRGVTEALTGPVVRGDVDTVRRHLASLPPSLRVLYRALTRQSLLLAADRVPESSRDELRDLLQD